MNAALTSALAALAFAAPLAAEAAAEPASALPDTHLAYTAALLQLLEQTDDCLNSCRDSAGCAAALPRLEQLSKRAAELSAALLTLPEPTVQDYMAAHPHVATFNKLWKSIGEHIERLEKDKLMTEDMRRVLGIAPPTQP